MACDDDSIVTTNEALIRMGKSIDDPAELSRLEALLGDASSAIRAVTGRPFGSLTTTQRFSVVEGVVYLGRFVTAVTAVAAINGTALTVAWDGWRRLYVGIPYLNQFDVDEVTPAAVDVTYTRSGPPAPRWVKAMAVQMAARAYGRPPEQTGVQQESIAGYSYTVGAAAAAGAIGMLPAEEALLRSKFPSAGGTAFVGLRP